MTVARTTESMLTNAASAWRTAAVLCFVTILAILALFYDTGATMVRTWINDQTFTHGFLIPPIFGYLVWRRRDVLAASAPRVEPWGLAFVALAAFGWLLGALAGVQAVEQLALVALIQASVFTILGRSVTALLVFPLAYLYFAVPLGQFLVPPLQDVTATFSVALLRMVGVPVFMDGVFISIPTGNFEVAEACAGVRFLIAMVALGTLYAHLMYRSWPRRIAFLALSIVVPIIANGFRAFGIILIAYLSDNEVAVGVDHIVYGWVFFVFVMLVTLGLGMLFREDLDEADSVSREEDAAAERLAPAEAFSAHSSVRFGRGSGAFVAATLAVVALSAAAPAYAALIDARSGDTPRSAELPRLSAPWRAVDEDAGWRIAVPGATFTVEQSYAADDGRRVAFAVAYLPRQRQGAEVINQLNSFLDSEVWMRLGSGRDRVRLGETPIDVAFTRYADTRNVTADERRLVWVWYWIDGRFTASPYVAKLLEVRAKLLGGIEAAAVIAVAADYSDRREEAVRTLRAFLSAVEPLDRYLARLAGRKDGDG